MAVHKRKNEDLPLIDAVRQAWCLESDCCLAPVDSPSSTIFKLNTTHGQSYYLKQRPNPEYAVREFALLSWLSEHGIAASPPLLTHTQQPSMCRGDDVYSMYVALSGEIPSDHYTSGGEERARVYGCGIARLHKQFAKYPQQLDFRMFDPYAEITEWIREYAQQDLAKLQADHVSDITQSLCEFLAQHQSRLPSHLIHRDIHPANMLLADGKMSGYLDFDLACNGVRLFDPCYCLTSMLVGGFGCEENRYRWLLLLTQLLSGYHSVGSLQEDERKAVFWILITIQTIFVSFSCRIGRLDMAQCNADIMVWLSENRQQIEQAVEKVR